MSHVLVEAKDRVLRIELARPEKKNALSPGMYADMARAFAAADADANVRAVLIHGAGGCFTSGNDVRDFLELPRGPADSPASGFLRAIAAAKKPVVAAVGGPAVGIGTTMLLHFDLIYAAPNARFQLPFVPLGLLPEAASSLLLPMIAGYQRAAELLLLGQPFTADKALAAGFVTEIVPEAELLEYARTAALALAALPPASVRMTKELMKRALAPAVRERMQEELGLFGERLKSPEAKEALSAFMEKRKPDFSRFS
ncbi:MAG TPA: enoyl-CoA hydratase-related protein [Burkholderiales bacterium]|nr:enoyl-CoA hydratase-related protein [Burkholderiales bacterium]